jgi:hypothetical protein
VGNKAVNQKKLQPLLEELKKCQDICQNNVYEHVGRKGMMEMCNAVENQQSLTTTAMYQNNVQVNMVQ